MFLRLLWNLLRASRGRLTVALVAVVSGAAVISALINLDLDAGKKLTREFRTLGANLVVEPPRAPGTGPAAPALLDDAVLARVVALRTPEVVAEAPYLYVVAQAEGRAVVVAGTWLDEARQLEPWWKIDGEGVASRDDLSRCLVGQNAARLLVVAPGSPLELRSGERSVQLTVAGVVNAGGAEDNQIFVNLPVAQQLGGLGKQFQVVQVSVSGAGPAILSYAARMAAALPGVEVRPVPQIAEAEGLLLARIRWLILSMELLILVLTALCVLVTMAALAMERRQDVGLMKALGGSISRVTNLFLAEAGVLGALGGLLGYLLGMGLSSWVGRRVFDAAIAPRLEVLPLTVALMMAVALAGAFPLRLLGKVRPAVILRGE
jgi:putative ABC transport system permease protein